MPAGRRKPSRVMSRLASGLGGAPLDDEGSPPMGNSAGNTTPCEGSAAHFPGDGATQEEAVREALTGASRWDLSSRDGTARVQAYTG